MRKGTGKLIVLMIGMGIEIYIGNKMRATLGKLICKELGKGWISISKNKWNGNVTGI